MGRDAPDRLSLRSLTNRIFLSAGLILGGIGVAVATGAAKVSTLPGAVCGAGIACGNFFLIRKILEKAFSEGDAIRKGFTAQYVLKFLGLVGVVYLVIMSGWFDTLGFLLGLSCLFLGILLEGVTRAAGMKTR